MTKKRKLINSHPVKVEVKEENVLGNDYQMAKGRLKGVLKQLTEQSSEEGSDSSEDNRMTMNRNAFDRKRKVESMPVPYRHTYVMKLFDRSVDLARFEEDTPLYPICRAWMQNHPRNPQPIIKRRLSSPEPDSPHWSDSSISEVTRLPPPAKVYVSRVPSPIPEQKQDKDSINLNYEESPPIEKDSLMQDHLERWGKVKRKWMATSAKHEARYARSGQVLNAIYTKSHENTE